MTMCSFNFKSVDPSWHSLLQKSLANMDHEYLKELSSSKEWLPGDQNIFNAFSIPFNQVNYILFGESPYPRPLSANGYAFWDAAVTNLWSPTGLSKEVNRATSLRNIIKMLLIAEGALNPKQTGQAEIAKINKKNFVQTNNELFTNLLNHGFLLLNTSLVLRQRSVHKEARIWLPFMHQILTCLIEQRPQVKLILLGQIATIIEPLIKNNSVQKLIAPHPYNLSFITNEDVLSFFKPLNLLKK